MKKKKLKKLKKRIDYLVDNLTEALKLNISDTMECKKAITKLENDNKYYKEWMDRSGVDYKSWFGGENNGN